MTHSEFVKRWKEKRDRLAQIRSKNQGLRRAQHDIARLIVGRAVAQFTALPEHGKRWQA